MLWKTLGRQGGQSVKPENGSRVEVATPTSAAASSPLIPLAAPRKKLWPGGTPDLFEASRGQGEGIGLAKPGVEEEASPAGEHGGRQGRHHVTTTGQGKSGWQGMGGTTTTEHGSG